MAEAVKEKPKIKQKTVELIKEQQNVNEITDQNLEERLKSLTSFINNIEPNKIDLTNFEHNVLIKQDSIQNEPTPNTSNYYEMISEKVQEQQILTKNEFSHLNTILTDLKKNSDLVENPKTPSAPLLTSFDRFEPEKTNQVIDFNIEQIKQINKLNYPRLNWNQTTSNVHNQSESIDIEWLRFYDNDQLCKDLDVYYKCKLIQNDAFNSNLTDFIRFHSNLNEYQYDTNNTSQHRKNEFYELLKDYYEARKLVLRCERHINEFKWTTIGEQMNKIWSFEKYTIESSGVCGDQQRCKHELTSEKAYLNRIELTKLQSMFYELRFNLIKNGLISSQFCSKLAKLKLESFLHEFLLKFETKNQINNENYLNFNSQLKILVDVIFYFYRKHTRPNQIPFQTNKPENPNTYYELDDAVTSQTVERDSSTQDEEDDMENFSDEVFKEDLKEWIKTLSCLLLNKSDSNRIEALKHAQSQNLVSKYSSLHFENLFFILQHLLRSNESLNFSYLIQIPFLNLESKNENLLMCEMLHLNSSKSDQLINLYFDNYLKFIASFSFSIKFRQEFLGLNNKIIENFRFKSNMRTELNQKIGKQPDHKWEFIDLEGEIESVESVLVDINEDDLVKLYYQIPFNRLFSFLWFYLEYQSNGLNNVKNENDRVNLNTVDFRKGYVSMKIVSFLDNLARLSIRSLLIYNRLKYKSFSKLIGKTLRDIINFISNILSKYDRVDNLRIHYDNFIKRIFTTIIYSSRLKSIRWTILNQLNISKLNLSTKWLLLSIMCGIDVFHTNFELIFRQTNKPTDYIEQACQNDLESILVKDSVDTADIELLSFMKTLHFLIDLEPDLATEPDRDNTQLMSSVIKVIFKIAYCYKSTQDICYKEGNSILFAICSTYPCLIGSILNEIDTELNRVGKKSLYLCADLPFNKWLSYIDCKKDIHFMQKCLLMNYTNSILFRLCTNLIDSLNFELDTREKSETYLNKSNRLNSNLAELISNYGLIDQTTVFKIRLSIILFELHSRLTNYSYFSKNITNDDHLFDSNLNLIQNVVSNEDLNEHYNKISKDKRMEIVCWIWSTLYRINLFIQIDSLRFIDYIEELTSIYSSNNNSNEIRINSKYLTKFYKIYLSIDTTESNNETEINSNNSHTVNTVLIPKCPLESYLRLVFTCSGHDLKHVFDHSVELFLNVLNTNKKNLKLSKFSYLILFDWFENLLKKFTIKSNLNLNHRLEEFRQARDLNNAKLSQLILLLFSYNSSQYRLTESYCKKLKKTLTSFRTNKSQQDLLRLEDENFNSFLLIIIETFIKTIKNWHKYKNIVKLIDFLLCFSFDFNHKRTNNLINNVFLDEFITYVRTDFGISESSDSILNSEVRSIDLESSTSNNLPNNQNPSWLQPSFSWLSNSLTYVVSSTTHQITNTVGSAIGALANTNNEFFESNQQQFTYDKRLYKECPYVGFYLSLCEERIESQLALWTIFRSYLLGINDPLANTLDLTSNQPNLNSVSYIESCWRKTLNFVNKKNNLNLSFSPQRLMLFKWCERAIELPYEHPLLILYWQKFFNIYLDKEYFSMIAASSLPVNNHRGNSFDLELTSTTPVVNTNAQIQSLTFKLFTSTSQMNSLLKQMKKQLELTSQYYAYEIQKSDQSVTNAPVSSYHFNEFMSKLFYALSLWIDETRLHDPNLYLPALPIHYEPNLLAKIFTKQSDLWIEYVDMNKVKNQIYLVINSSEKLFSNENESEIIVRKSNTTNSIQNDLFFKQIDRLVIGMPHLFELNLRFLSPLKEKFGDTIENLLNLESVKSKSSKDEVNLIVNVSEHLLKNIFKYNKDFVNHTLNHMLKLDDKLTNKLLIHLWNNEMCEKYVQVPCSSIVNPLHQCTRPAMVKFVYEIATKRDQFRHDIKENRVNHDKLMANFVDLNHSTSSSKFPHDDIVMSMVAMSQLIKRLLRNHHMLLQSQDKDSHNEESNNHLILTKLFYLLIDLYETHMNHPNDVLNPAKSASLSNSTSSTNLTGWSTILFKAKDSLDTMNDQFNSDSIHLFMFDLIHLIGTNFIQTSNLRKNPSHKKTNQHILLEKIIQKLTSTITATNAIENSASLSRTSSTNTTTNGAPQTLSNRRTSSILLNLTRNKLSLLSLCAQYVEPNDLDLFNDFYLSILSSISSILLNESKNVSNSDPSLPSLDSTEMINQKFSIILQLLTKFSFISLNKLLRMNTNQENNTKICTDFVDINLNFLSDLDFDILNTPQRDLDLSDTNLDELKKRDLNIKLIVNQCIDNYISILNVNYPTYFEYMLKKCLEFSSKNFTIKFGLRHLNSFVNIYKQNELLSPTNNLLEKNQYEVTFRFLSEFFKFEKSKFKSQKRSFYCHWSNFARQLTNLYSNLYMTYFDKYLFKNLSQEDNFEKQFDSLFKQFTEFYSVWIDPSSTLEVSSNMQINVNEIYKNEIASIEAKDESLNIDLITSPQSSVLIMIDSFLLTFYSIIERVKMIEVNTTTNISLFQQNAKNFALNKLIHYYYEKIVFPLNKSSPINDNSLDCYHRCLSKYSTSWFGNGQFEPDYRSINIMSELCSEDNYRPIKFLAFNIVCYFDLNRITESYFRKVEIKPIQINDLLKCILKLLTEFSLRDSIRESVKFEDLLRPVYNQAEVLQCWSMLSDTSYSSVVIERFLPNADYHYAFSSRGTDRGLLMNLLKSSAEFYSLADRNSLSCFSSAKRRCFLKVVCELLLKPNVQSIKTELDSFQNCIMNLLTDIETFSISAVSSSTDDLNATNLNHEIQLLIDECLSLLSSGQNREINDLYQTMFETWISSSKDSPILIHFINRISKSYNLLMIKNNSEKYCNLLELCIEVFFETYRSNLNENDLENSVLLNQIINDQTNTIGWKMLMNDIDFLKLSDSDLFEFKLLHNSSYLLHNCYMNQRLALFKATFNERSVEFFNEVLKYKEKILSSFFNTNQSVSKPQPSKEEKFFVILNKFIEVYLIILYNSNSRLIESKIGEQLMKLTSLLLYYGEDTLTGQNPLNDGQSIGSDLLASIGLNILAKKSPYSIKFRFFCRSMAICLLKQIMILKESDLDLMGCKIDHTSSHLFPELTEVLTENGSQTKLNKSFYKIRMSHSDLASRNDIVNFNKPISGSISPTESSSSVNLLSTSLPNNSNLNHLQEEQSSLLNKYNQQLKQAAYQFHLLFQTKSYAQYSELASYVNHHLTQKSQYFCLPQCLNMSKYLCAKLFSDKYYLF